VGHRQFAHVGCSVSGHLDEFPRLHPRTQVVRVAETAFGTALLKLVEKHDLTEIEVMRMLLSEAQRWSVYILRRERHPRNPNKKADEA